MNHFKRKVEKYKQIVKCKTTQSIFNPLIGTAGIVTGLLPWGFQAAHLKYYRYIVIYTFSCYRFCFAF